MCFALPEILRPDNTNLALWLNQDLAKESLEAGCRKTMPTDNLSTWLSTRYAANQNKKSSANNNKNSRPEETTNLDMWLAEKRRKLEVVDRANRGLEANEADIIVRPIQQLKTQPLSSWLQSNPSEPESPSSIIEAQMSNLSVVQNMDDVSEWLQSPPPQDVATGAVGQNEMADWLVYESSDSVAKTHHASGFPMPESHLLPVQDWLVPAPKTPLDDRLAALDLEEDKNNVMIKSWLEDNNKQEEEMSKIDQEEQGDELDQWLLVTDDSNCNAAKSVSSGIGSVVPAEEDDQSSIVVLDEEDQADQLLQNQMEVASNFSWKFW